MYTCIHIQIYIYKLNYGLGGLASSGYCDEGRVGIKTKEGTSKLPANNDPHVLMSVGAFQQIEATL
jgi:hypothetical protein